MWIRSEMFEKDEGGRNSERRGFACYAFVARERLRFVGDEDVRRKYFTIPFGGIMDNFSDNASHSCR